MIRSILRSVCVIVIVIGLLRIYTLFYGGPLGPFFVWLTHYFPVDMQFSPPATPLKPVTG